MNVMGNTITGAASGETACGRRRRIHNLRQKDRREFLNYFILFLTLRLDHTPIFFYFFEEVNDMEKRRAVVSVIGKDQVGIIAKVTTILAENHINIFDISQTTLQDFFTMMMLVDVTEIDHLTDLQDQLNGLGEEMGLKINVQLEDIFQSMHRI